MKGYVLVVDDSKAMADALCDMLRLLDVQPRAAYGPREALYLIRQERPRMVFLDIHMPGVDGFEVFAFLRREPNMGQVPVAVVTSDDQPVTRQRAYGMGAVAFIVKPPTFEALEAALAHLSKVADGDL